MAKKVKPFFQTKDCSNEKYWEDFDAYVARIESYGGSIGYKEGYKEGLIEEKLRVSAKDPENPIEQKIKYAKIKVKNACMFISGAKKERYGDLKTELLKDKARSRKK